jgi:hypothetical protein
VDIEVDRFERVETWNVIDKVEEDKNGDSKWVFKRK